MHHADPQKRLLFMFGRTKEAQVELVLKVEMKNKNVLGDST